MELAHELAEAGALAGQGVVARRQRSGRGRHGRPWSAEVGGLWLSVVCRPDAGRGLEALSLRVGLGVAAALEAAVPGLPRIDLKWPNDLLLGGRKLGGILCEARWQAGRCPWVVVGVGINVSNAIPDPLTGTATRVADWVAIPPDPLELAGPVREAVAASATGGPLETQKLRAWRIRDALRGSPVREPREGVADGITADGALIIQAPDGTRHECRGGVVAITD